jgi:hypothetical protein
MIALAHSRFETTSTIQPEGRRTIAELTKNDFSVSAVHLAALPAG